MKKVNIQIPSMQSTHCRMRVENAIKNISGVVIGNIQPGQAEIIVDTPEQKEQVVSSIEKAGYQVTEVETEETK